MTEAELRALIEADADRLMIAPDDRTAYIERMLPRALEAERVRVENEKIENDRQATEKASVARAAAEHKRDMARLERERREAGQDAQ